MPKSIIPPKNRRAVRRTSRARAAVRSGNWQILRQRTIRTSTYAATDRWFHYDRVGSVLSVSDGDGDLAVTHQQDAFGNVIASWSGGEWESDAGGWHQHTLARDADVELYYNDFRWRMSAVGTFTSASPLRPDFESRYVVARSVPNIRIDPSGMVDVNPSYYFMYLFLRYPRAYGIINSLEHGILSEFSPLELLMVASCRALGRTAGRCINPATPDGGSDGHGDAIRHCVLMCCLGEKVGGSKARWLGLAHEGFASEAAAAMDHLNNAIGIGLGVNINDGTTCRSKCLKARRRGALYVLFQRP